MKKIIRTKILATVVILGVVSGGMQMARVILQRQRVRSVLSLNLAKAKGDPKAAVKIIEYTDFQCPACAVGSVLIKSYLQMYPGKLFIEFRNFPLDMHPRAIDIAVAGECAARQRKFWEFHDLAFSRQNLLKQSVNLPGRLLEIAQEIRVDRGSYEKCLVDPAIKQGVLAEKEEGTARKVNATPTYFIGDKMFVGSKMLAPELEKLIGRIPHEGL